MSGNLLACDYIALRCSALCKVVLVNIESVVNHCVTLFPVWPSPQPPGLMETQQSPFRSRNYRTCLL